MDWAQKSAMSMLATALRDDARYEEARVVCLAGLAACDDNLSCILDLLDGLASCNRALGRYDDELENLREIYSKTEVAFGRDEKTYAAALRYGKVLVEQSYVHDALLLLNEVSLDAEGDLGREHALVVDVTHAWCLSLWLYHFLGHSDYRSEFQVAVQALLLLLARTQDADQTRQIEQTLCMVLTHQLDWSLDDLELDSTDRQIVDRVLADLPAPDFEIELNDRLRTVIIT